MKQAMTVLTSSRSNLWYTPPHWIERVRDVLIEIDLDPASDSIAQTWIQAGRYYSESGLEKYWKGRVFVNPPYGRTKGRSNQAAWIEHLYSAYLCGYVEEAIILTKTVPGYVWWDSMFHTLWPGPCCITRGRISFVNGDLTDLPDSVKGDYEIAKWLLDRWRENGKQSKAASTFWYCGENPERFTGLFGMVGRVIEPKDMQ